MLSQSAYAEEFDKLFKQRAELALITNNVTDVCAAPWMSDVLCQMHYSEWNDDQIREVRRNWLRGIRPKQCEGCPLKFSANLDLIKDSTDPDGYTKLQLRVNDGI